MICLLSVCQERAVKVHVTDHFAWSSPQCSVSAVDLDTLALNTDLTTVKDSPNSHGFVDVRVIEQKWKDMFTYFYRYVALIAFVLRACPDTVTTGKKRMAFASLSPFILMFQGDRVSATR
jgi:hypothetical protein